MAEFYLLDVYRSNDFAAAVASDAAATPRNGIEHLGQCVARRDSSAVIALVRTEPASDDEREAIQALVPHLGPCVRAGETVQFTPVVVRAIAAVGLYQLVVNHAAAVAAAPEGSQ